jgi:hypothetical protein
MCAQFRNHNLVPGQGEDSKGLQGPPVGAGALVVLASPMHLAIDGDVHTAMHEYEASLEALREQRVVLEMLQEAMDRGVPARRLQADAATQTDLTGCADTLPLRELVLRKLQISRARQRRVLAQRTYRDQLVALKDEVEQLQATLEDITPQGVAMVGVGREGSTIVAMSPTRH